MGETEKILLLVIIILFATGYTKTEESQYKPAVKNKSLIENLIYIPVRA